MISKKIYNEHISLLSGGITSYFILGRHPLGLVPYFEDIINIPLGIIR